MPTKLGEHGQQKVNDRQNSAIPGKNPPSKAHFLAGHAQNCGGRIIVNPVFAACRRLAARL